MNEELEWLVLRAVNAAVVEQKLHEAFLRGKANFQAWKTSEQEREKAVWTLRAAKGEV